MVHAPSTRTRLNHNTYRGQLGILKGISHSTQPRPNQWKNDRRSWMHDQEPLSIDHLASTLVMHTPRTAYCGTVGAAYAMYGVCTPGVRRVYATYAIVAYGGVCGAVDAVYSVQTRNVLGSKCAEHA